MYPYSNSKQKIIIIIIIRISNVEAKMFIPHSIKKSGAK